MNWIEFIAFVFCAIFIGGGMAVLALDCLDDLIGIYQQRKQECDKNRFVARNNSDKDRKGN